MSDNFTVSNPTVASDQAHGSAFAQSSSPGVSGVEVAGKLKKLHIGLILGLVLIAALFLAVVILTIAFSVEISELKSSDSGQQQALDATEDRLQSLLGALEFFVGCPFTAAASNGYC